jgi:hypothetical protein
MTEAHTQLHGDTLKAVRAIEFTASAVSGSGAPTAPHECVRQIVDTGMTNKMRPGSGFDADDRLNGKTLSREFLGLM